MDQDPPPRQFHRKIELLGINRLQIEPPDRKNVRSVVLSEVAVTGIVMFHSVSMIFLAHAIMLCDLYTVYHYHRGGAVPAGTHRYLNHHEYRERGNGIE